ncbi:hypothetical protein [Caballeronia sp. LjRoot31]|uniref:hypothetical protein n=1 Tax=Caballeronia sp. LjRoot31 TaxID=3342324 RepID=UPI003ED0813E
MNENYMDWEFVVDGNPHELRDLSESLGTAYFRVHGGIDHYLDCRNDDFRMSTLYAQDETESHTVWQVGYELVGLFNGASALLTYNIRRMSIPSLLYKGSSAGVKWEPMESSAALLGPPPFSQQRIDEEQEHGRRLSFKFSLIHLATENQDVYFILKYLNMEASWVSYYKLLEAVEQFAAAKSIALGTDEKTRKAFTNTANNFSLSGFDSRHGFKQAIKQNKTASMTLEEAHAFVTSVVKTFLKKAYFPPSAAANT